MRISDWSSDVCSSDLKAGRAEEQDMVQRIAPAARRLDEHAQIVARRRLADELVQPLGAKRGVDIRRPGSARSSRHSPFQLDRTSVVLGTSVSVRVALGCRRITKQKKKHKP